MSTIKADTVQNTSGGAVTLTNQSAAKAWINFNEPSGGSSTVQQSFNNSSLTDHGNGDQSVTYINAFNYTDYAYSFTHHRSGASDPNRRSYGHDISTTTARVRHVYQFSTLTDIYDGMVISHGDLA